MNEIINCKICNKPFKQITTTHLKSHRITAKEYKNLYGDLYSESMRDSISKMFKGKPSHRKGKLLTNEHKLKIQQSLKNNPKCKGWKHTKQWKSEASVRQKNLWKNMPDDVREKISRKMSEKSKGIKKLIKPWNYKKKNCFSKDTIIRMLESRKNSDQCRKIYKSKEFRNKMSEIVSNGISDGKYLTRFTGTKRGWFKKSNGKLEYYHSSYELARMIQLERENKTWTKKHNLSIPYEMDGFKKRYVPDFLVDSKTIEEIKPKRLLGDNINIIKFKAAKRFCNIHGYKFRILTENELGIKI